MNRMKQITRWLLCVIIVVTNNISMEISAIPQWPEPEVSWKNIMPDKQKIAVFCMYRDGLGLMWLGTNSGLYFYDGVTVHAVKGDELANTQVYSVVECEHQLYLGTNNGLLIYDYTKGVVMKTCSQLPKEIRCMLQFDHQLWIGSLYGIYQLNLRTGRVVDHSTGLPHKSVYSMLRDSRGILYVGTYNGLARWNTVTCTFVELNDTQMFHDMNNLFVNCLLESPDSGNIFIGTEGELYEYIPTNDRWNRIAALENNNIKSLAKGSKGHILIGTDNGIFDWSRDTIHHYRHDSRQDMSLKDNEIWCILSDTDHNIWAGHECGFSIASNQNTIITNKLSSLAPTGEGNEFHSIYRDSRHQLWLGGTNGILRMTEGGAIHWYRHSNLPRSLSHNRIRAIDEDSDHRIWLSTDAGLNRYNPTTDDFDIFRIVDHKGGHNSNWVYAFEEEKEYYWVGSFLSGLHRAHKSKFETDGGIIVADYSLNADVKLSCSDGLVLDNDLVNDMIVDSKGDIWILLFRDKILCRYSPEQEEVVKYDIHQMTGSYPTHLCLDDKGRIWCAFQGGVIVFNHEENHTIVKFPHTNSDESVLALGRVGRDIWVSTQSNVWCIDGDHLVPKLLPIPQKAYTAVYEDTMTGKVLLGGIDEILEVDHRNLSNVADYKAIRLVLHDNGKGHFDLVDLNGAAKDISIPYGGSITMVVSTLDYSFASPQRFMYSLSKDSADEAGRWIVMSEGANTITLSDLNMGDYTILVKTVGAPVAPISIPLQVQPPWYLSCWAIGIYLLWAISIVTGIIYYMKQRNLRVFQEQERQTALENVERKLSFLSSISHDLKTPLSMILGPVSLMKERTKDPESKRTLETVYDNAVRLNNMIHRTLELQHLEDGEEHLLILSMFDVVDFCKGVFEVFKENNTEKNFIFHASCPQLFIEADAVKFESVIVNLLSNACKYSDEGATISCGINTNGSEVEITVSDDGIGIAAIDQAFVFQRMFRAPSTSTLHEGTGLGLYLIKKYLELMNGNITLYSKEGQGTTFVVTLPVSEKALPVSFHHAPGEETGKPKILIVEDNAQISGFLVEILSDNYTCFTAENGRSGLSIAASMIPDLLLVDEMMPIMNGMEMVKRIKQHPRLSSVPIIMLTAKSDNKTENESIKLGIDVFMTKPFEPVTLLGRISHLLKGRTEIKEKLRAQTLVEAESKPIEAESVNEKILAKIAKVVEDNISDPDLNVNQLCEKSGIPNKQMYRLIKKYMGIGPLDYIRRVRLQKAAVLLSQHRFTVSEISYMVGFKTPSYFAKCFQNQYGVKPSQYEGDDQSVSHK